jgi:hypothetical protein
MSEVKSSLKTVLKRLKLSGLLPGAYFGEVDGPVRVKAMAWFGGRRWASSDEGDGLVRRKAMGRFGRKRWIVSADVDGRVSQTTAGSVID